MKCRASRRAEARLARLRDCGDDLGRTALTSLIAGTATLLFSAYHFQQTAPLGVLGNLLALPLVSFVIMPFAVLSVLAMPFGFEAPFVCASWAGGSTACWTGAAGRRLERRPDATRC